MLVRRVDREGRCSEPSWITTFKELVSSVEGGREVHHVKSHKINKSRGEAAGIDDDNINIYSLRSRASPNSNQSFNSTLRSS